MDPHPTPFPGKNQPLKPKPNRKTTERSEPLKPTPREHVTYRQKRVFGAVRNANIPTRTVLGKPTVDKPSVGVSRKHPLRSRHGRTPVTEDAKENFPENLKPESNQKRVSIQEEAGENTPAVKASNTVPRKQQQRTLAARVPVIEAAKKQNSPEIPKPKSKQKRVSLQEEAGEKTPVVKLSVGVSWKQPQKTPAAGVPVTDVGKKDNSSEIPQSELDQKRLLLQELEESGEKTPFEKLRTPVAASPSLSHCKFAGSSYHSAKICSKCQFDRLETSSYWLAQIKLSEYVGKHFVSAAFFKLALESKAEPIGKLCFELKQYLARNRHIAGQTEWKEVCVSYGEWTDKKEKEGFDSAIEKSGVPQTTNVEQPNRELPEDPEHDNICETETD